MELTPLLFSVAEDGDPIAREIVRRQADEVVALAATAIRRLGALSEPIDVVLGGGVLTAGHPLLIDEITRLLADQAPLAKARVVDAPPILGAALLGLDRIAADDDAHERLRTSFRALANSGSPGVVHSQTQPAEPVHVSCRDGSAVDDGDRGDQGIHGGDRPADTRADRHDLGVGRGTVS